MKNSITITITILFYIVTIFFLSSNISSSSIDKYEYEDSRNKGGNSVEIVEYKKIKV